MDKTTEKFVNFTADINYSDLTPQAIHAVKRSFVDSIGCALGSFRIDAVAAARNLAAQVSATRPATVIGTRIKTAPEWAAFANGGAIRYLDFSDDYYGGTGDMGPHPSDNICGVLAAAESAGADGEALILGIAIAYEVVGHIADGIVLNGVKPSWDYPVFHSAATALGGGKVMGLNREQLRHALALGVIPNIALSQTRLGTLSNWKGFRGPNGSRNGLFAAILAQGGISGPVDPFEGKSGLMNHFNQHFEVGTFGGKGNKFKVEGTYFKCIPVRYTAQLPVWVALESRDQLKPDEIESICVFREKRSLIAGTDNEEYWNPTTRETADHSLPYLIGAALIDGEISEKTFTPERFRDPKILSFIRCIRMEEDKNFTADFPRTFNCRLEVKLKTGKTLTINRENPKGTLGNPFTDKELEDKFLKQSDPVLPRQQSRRLLDQLWQLDKVKDLSKIFEFMRVPDGR